MFPFSIDWRWTAKEEPDDHLERLEDWSPLFRAMRRFVRTREGSFTVHLGEHELEFLLDPDLSTVFEPLPGVLEALTADTTTPVFLDFFEQGTELLWELRREGASIRIRFHKGTYTGAQFATLPEQAEVEAGAFLGSWVGLLEAVLAELVALDPGLAEEESYRDYAGRLRRVAGSLTGVSR